MFTASAQHHVFAVRLYRGYHVFTAHVAQKRHLRIRRTVLELVDQFRDGQPCILAGRAFRSKGNSTRVSGSCLDAQPWIFFGAWGGEGRKGGPTWARHARAGTLPWVVEGQPLGQLHNLTECLLSDVSFLTHCIACTYHLCRIVIDTLCYPYGHNPLCRTVPPLESSLPCCPQQVQH